MSRRWLNNGCCILYNWSLGEGKENKAVEKVSKSEVNCMVISKPLNFLVSVKLLLVKKKNKKNRIKDFLL
jgi:hypothetical protein